MMEPIQRWNQKTKEGTWYHEFHFIGGEMVTIFDDGTWNYEDALQKDSWLMGSWFQKKNEAGKLIDVAVVHGSPKVPDAVIWALEDMKFKVET